MMEWTPESDHCNTVYSVAWLVAARKFKGRWTGMAHRKRVQERLCVTILYYFSTEFQRTLIVYWNGIGVAGLSCTYPVI